MSDVRSWPRGWATTRAVDETDAAAARTRARRRGRGCRDGGWYVVLTAIWRHHGVPVRVDAADVAQGPDRRDHVGAAAVPPERPDARNYVKVWDSLPIASFFLNSVIVAVATGLLNVLVAALAAYPLAKMRFSGREAIFYAAARDAHRAGPADLHPELRARGQRVPATTTRCRR